VHSLKDCAEPWFNSFYPMLATGLTADARLWIDRLNRVGMVYFRPMVVAILKSKWTEANRIEAFKMIERYLFLVFRTTTARANYGDSEFYNAARDLNQGNLSLTDLRNKLDARMKFLFDDTGTIKIDEFYGILSKKFDQGTGYYRWVGLHYFLYEYEASLMSESRQKKVDWDDLLKSERDMISIEHIYPQTETPDWAVPFVGVAPEQRPFYNGSLGNLLVLSKSINSSLQNDNFQDKKRAKIGDQGEKLRNGYSDGSHSEIEVSQNETWGPEQIKVRGIKLLKFMETRWDFRFKNDEERAKLLFLDTNKEPETTAPVENPEPSQN
jgi:hypothetical protein